VEEKYVNVLEKIQRDSEGKRDYTTALSNVHMDYNGKIAFRDTTAVEGPSIRDINFDITDWGQSQIFNKLGMPTQYFKKARLENPDLVASHFNYWAEKSDSEVLIRTKVKNQEHGLIRGVLSDKYTMLDNDMASETLGAILAGHDDKFSVKSYHLDDTRLHIRMTFPDMTKKLGVTPSGEPDYQQIGMDFVNSEVGASSLNILSMVYRLVCSNGLRRWEVDESFVQRHIYHKSIELLARMAGAITTSINVGQEVLQGLENTMLQQIESPFTVIDNLAKDGNFTNEFTDRAKTLFEGEDTAYGIINAFTASARDLPNDRRLDAEKFAGRLIKLKPGEWTRLAEPAA